MLPMRFTRSAATQRTGSGARRSTRLSACLPAGDAERWRPTEVMEAAFVEAFERKQQRRKNAEAKTKTKTKARAVAAAPVAPTEPQGDVACSFCLASVPPARRFECKGVDGKNTEGKTCAVDNKRVFLCPSCVYPCCVKAELDSGAARMLDLCMDCFMSFPRAHWVPLESHESAQRDITAVDWAAPGVKMLHAQ